MERETADVLITTGFIRLDAFLKLCASVSSGGEAKHFIQNGAVSVNGQICTQRGRKLTAGDTVRFGGKTYRVVSDEN
ncbi:MAG TPA: RNA-binding S4 domain-containing protein [Clostridiales bacterium]|nr:MAG: ribosome-associated protein [Firmicutes bacterium ADurb.Bin262]HOU09949.1 RNA-binding S4 domain-containing protein [Clostridiales bacterium]HQH63267.1 RNA-binding S4 domain-containing protein [Clostridiales bacterium]HQK73193.1 RNA-binding S4 domain-containing protein [Clostridiales bacterium]